MRDVLFRGRHICGLWRYGNLTVKNSGNTIITPYNTSRAKYEEVDPETVGQYTGLTDKNGVRIFEGDILKTTNSNCTIWFVDYKATAFCANQGNANYSCVLDDFMQRSQVEVIGNVYDNPELLEGGDTSATEEERI